MDGDVLFHMSRTMRIICQRLTAGMCGLVTFSTCMLSLNGQSVSESSQVIQNQYPISSAVAGPTLQETLPPTEASEVANADRQNRIRYLNSGPWGKLRYTYLYLEPPKDMVDALPLPHTKIRWTFRANDAAILPELFDKAGLPPDMKIRLSDSANQSILGDELNLFPSIEDVEAMTPAMREAIYPVLAASSTNQFYTFPILMTTKRTGEWFRTSVLRPELIEKIRSMSYRRGGAMGFSDVSVLMNYASSENEARTIFRSLLRTRTLMVQIELTQDQDIDSLVDYWTSGHPQRRHDIEPIIRSVIATEGIDTLELSHVLPPIPRKLLYTYPGSNYSFNGTLPDCHWTTLNFFHHEPHEFLLDTRFIISTVDEKCVPIEPPYKLGDYLFMLDPQSGALLHSCVYLADDIVFTKNGRNEISPWVVMKLEDVVSLYSQNQSIALKFFRLKNF